MDAPNVINLLRRNSRQVTEEEFDKKAADYKGFSYMAEEPAEGGFTTWEAREKALETPRPLQFRDRLKNPADWRDWTSHPRLTGQRFYILGAGASALTQPLSMLDGEIVYGINWTRKWFDPTFLQIIDPPVMETQVKERGPESWKETGTQLVTSTRCAVDLFGGTNNEFETLNFKVHHATQVGKQHEIHLAKTPEERLTWYSNSLGYALNVALWFRPSRIILLGFDFGGAHLFGDGRAEGSHCHYGLDGNLKPNLLMKLEKIRDFVQSHGIPIRQVGETELNLFYKCRDLEDASYQ